MNRIEKEIGDLCQTQLFALSALGSVVILLLIDISAVNTRNLKSGNPKNGNLQNPIPFFHFK